MQTQQQGIMNTYTVTIIVSATIAVEANSYEEARRVGEETDPYEAELLNAIVESVELVADEGE